ncbi:spore germination protein [Peribacillus aracenensis]|uniref:spore germination protein n=1 Tax=Peribacillus aracenensis TaxID=2976708 RepID=UPI0021A40711|nr:spore germination protein [Peribacillus sp. BBB004]
MKEKRKTKEFNYKEEVVPLEQKDIYSNIEENFEYFQHSFNYSSDLKKREINYNGKNGIILYLETVVDTEKLKTDILTPLTTKKNIPLELLISSAELKKTNNLNQAVSKILYGMSIVFIENENQVYMLNSSKIIERSPEEPTNEKIVRGSHEGFIENINTNLFLIRKRIVNRQLTIRYMELGEESNTKLALVYMEGLADSSVVKEVERRLSFASSDMLFSPGYIEEFIEDNPFSPFPHTLYTERPDRAMSHLMEGRVIIFADGSADVIIVPVTFFVFLQSPDDFNTRVYTGSFFRLLRLISFFISLTFPALYIAIIGFHFEVIPNDIIVLVKGSVEGIPFPPLIEALIMVFTIELIREAGVRLPTPIGQTIGIVGGLILGDAVINAGLISNFMVIIIAITAVASFTIPSYELSSTVRLLTFPLMVAASTLGLLGIVIVIMFIVAHLCMLESFGKPYFAPIAPLDISALKDTFVRFPIWQLNKRSRDLNPKKILRQHDTRGWDNQNE